MAWIRQQQGLGAVCLLLASWVTLAADPLKPEERAAYAKFQASLPPAGQYRIESNWNMGGDNFLPGPVSLRCLAQENLRELADETLGLVGKAQEHLVCDLPLRKITAQSIIHEKHCKARTGDGIQNIAILRDQLEIHAMQTLRLSTEQTLKARSLDGAPQPDLYRKEIITATRMGNCPPENPYAER